MTYCVEYTMGFDPQNPEMSFSRTTRVLADSEDEAGQYVRLLIPDASIESVYSEEEE